MAWRSIENRIMTGAQVEDEELCKLKRAFIELVNPLDSKDKAAVERLLQRSPQWPRFHALSIERINLIDRRRLEALRRARGDTQVDPGSNSPK